MTLQSNDSRDVDRGSDPAAVAKRVKAGAERRKALPRQTHAAWSPPPDRPDPIGLLRSSDVHRLPHLIPLRYRRMLASPFAFLRGAAAVMASDLASTSSTGMSVQLAGDAHLANFGSYATPERNLVFGVNDFDETLPGPWEWDIKRLAASIVVAGRSGGLGTEDCAGAAAAGVRSYREHMAQYAQMGYLELYYTQIDTAAVLGALSPALKASKRVRQGIKKARGRDNVQVLKALTTTVDGQTRIKDDPPLITHVPDPLLGDHARRLASQYLDTLDVDRLGLVQRYTVVDAALKVVGVGSVGTRCFIVLLRGASEADPLFLQIKQAEASVLEPYVGKSAFKTHGQRVVAGQRVIQAASDIFLGWGQDQKVHYYVRQLRDMKFAPDILHMTALQLAAYASLCGWALALAHARSGDPAQISGYMGRSDAFDRAVTAFANTYADQTERDHAALIEAVKSGRIPAETGA